MITIAKPPKPAVIPKAGMYLGASFGLKMFVEIKPAALARGTPTAEMTALLLEPGVLLVYQVEVKTDEADAPIVIKKQEK